MQLRRPSPSFSVFGNRDSCFIFVECVIAALTNHQPFPGVCLSLCSFSAGRSRRTRAPYHYSPESNPVGSPCICARTNQVSHFIRELIVRNVASHPLLKCGVKRSLQRGGLLRRPAGPRLSLVALPRRHHRRRQLDRGRGRRRAGRQRQRGPLGGQLVAAHAQQRRPLLDAKYEPQI